MGMAARSLTSYPARTAGPPAGSNAATAMHMPHGPAYGAEAAPASPSPPPPIDGSGPARPGRTRTGPSSSEGVGTRMSQRQMSRGSRPAITNVGERLTCKAGGHCV